VDSENTQLVATLRYKILSFLPADLPVTDLEDERLLLASLAEPSNREPVQTLWELVRFYRAVGKNDLASALIYHMLELDDSVDTKAFCYLGLGQIAEAREQYDAAIDFYTRGLTFRTKDIGVKYLLYNNTGYCLNVQEKYRAAESYCRLAIEIDSTRANAFKNLGLSLIGQNNLLGAAWAWIEATKADATDARALIFLEQLIADHPEVVSQFPGLWTDVVVSSKAIETALREATRLLPGQAEPVCTYEICRLRHVPGEGFTQLKEGVKRTISAEEIERLYTFQALKMLREYPKTWCAIVAEDVDKIPEPAASSDGSTRHRSFEPCLLVDGDLLERIKLDGLKDE
jgi:tetratricopeptide (TPR) repeat protein